MKNEYKVQLTNIHILFLKEHKSVKNVLKSFFLKSKIACFFTYIEFLLAHFRHVAILIFPDSWLCVIVEYNFICILIQYILIRSPCFFLVIEYVPI